MRKSSRDKARTLMQRNENIYAEFSDVNPWIMVNPNYKEINAKRALEDQNSIFYTYQN